MILNRKELDKMAFNILIVEDEMAILNLTMAVINLIVSERELPEGAVQIFPSATLSQAREILKNEKIDLAITDTELPDGISYSDLPELLQLPAIIATSGRPDEYEKAWLNYAFFMSKPWIIKEMKELISSYIKEV